MEQGGHDLSFEGEKMQEMVLYYMVDYYYKL